MTNEDDKMRMTNAANLAQLETLKLSLACLLLHVGNQSIHSICTQARSLVTREVHEYVPTTDITRTKKKT